MGKQSFFAFSPAHALQDQMNQPGRSGQPVTEDQPPEIKILGHQDAVFRTCQGQNVLIHRVSRGVPHEQDVRKRRGNGLNQGPADALVDEQPGCHTATKPSVRKCSAA